METNQTLIVIAGCNNAAVTSKQLLPIYDKPMIYYPLSTLMLAGIRDILIISTPQDTPRFEEILGNGERFGLSISYAIQKRPEGIAQSLVIGEDFIDGDKVCLILGDNVFFGHSFPDTLRRASNFDEGAVIFGYRVRDPQRYGVIEFDEYGKALSIEEKPVRPRSNYAVPGIYFYDSRAPEMAKNLKPSTRGELEITDLNVAYLEKGLLRVELIGRGTAWLDTGTPDSLLEASNFIATIERRQGLKIACVEEVAYNMGFITNDELRLLAEDIPNGAYRDYLLTLI